MLAKSYSDKMTQCFILGQVVLHWGTSWCIIFTKRDGLRVSQTAGSVLLGKLLWGRSGVPAQAHQRGPDARGSQPSRGPAKRILIQILTEIPILVLA